MPTLRRPDPPAGRSVGRVGCILHSGFRAAVKQRYEAPWHVGRPAAMRRVTSMRLDRLCLRIMGSSAFEVLQESLLLEARRQLTHLPANIAAIAYGPGFRCQVRFSRLSKKRYGMTPSA